MEDCIFCKIIKGDLPSKKEFENDKIVVFHDINPKAEVHILIVPKKHISSLIEAEKEDRDLLGDMMIEAKNTAQKLNFNRDGYKIVINNGRGSGQIIFHLHMHLLGGWKDKVKGWQV